MSSNFFYTFVLYLTLLPTVYAQLEKEKAMIGGIMDSIYQFDFLSADSLIAQLDSSQHPQTFNFLKSQYYRWTELPIHEKTGSVLAKYYLYLDVDHTPNSQLDTLVYVNNKLLKAEYYYNNNQIYQAFTQSVSLYNLLEPKLEIENTAIQMEWLLPLSLYHYYYDYYKNAGGILSSMMWFFEKGEKEKGLNGLKMLANSDELGKTEALIYLSHIYLRLENQADSAYKYSLALHKLHPQNKKFYELLIESDLSSKNFSYDTQPLVEALLTSDSKYFNKYGIVYQVMYKTIKEQEENIFMLQNTLEIVDSLGKGNHLKSLLYARLYFSSSDKTNKDYYSKLVNKHRQYVYNLSIVD